MSVNVVALGHVGGEASLEAAMVELDARLDVTWTLVAEPPAEQGIDVLGGFGFTTRARAEPRLSALLSAARGEGHLEPGDSGQALLDAVAGADAVLLAGGGCLSSSWPAPVYERAALAQVAAARGVPLVVSGQSLGPALTARDGELVGAVVTSAQLVGVRDRASGAVARQLGLPAERLWVSVDDSWTLPGRRASAKHVAVTLHAGTGEVEQLAQLLDDLVDLTDLEVRLVPLDLADLAFHARLADAAKSTRVRSSQLLSPVELAAAVRTAALVLTSRTQQAVLAQAHATPVVALSVDDETESLLQGALDLLGQPAWCVSALGVSSGLLGTAVAEAWSRREELSAGLRTYAERWDADKRSYWDAVAAVIERREIPSAPRDLLSINEGQVVRPQGDWVSRNEDALTWSRELTRQRADLLRAHDRAEQLREEAELALEDERRLRRAAVDEAIALQESLSVERAAGEAARWHNAEMLEQTFALVAERDAELQEQAKVLEQVAERADELDRLKETKLLRWTQPARDAYTTRRRR